MKRLLVTAALVLVACAPARPVSAPPTTLGVDQPLPNVTPGATLPATASQVCTPGWSTAHRRSLTGQQKTTVLRAYGLPAGQHVAEWDHLIPLELGGANGVRNIWPELSEDDAHGKDRLENALHRQVCTGRLGLAQAQARIRVFWKEL